MKTSGFNISKGKNVRSMGGVLICSHGDWIFQGTSSECLPTLWSCLWWWWCPPSHPNWDWETTRGPNPASWQSTQDCSGSEQQYTQNNWLCPIHSLEVIVLLEKPNLKKTKSKSCSCYSCRKKVLHTPPTHFFLFNDHLGFTVLL